MTKVTVSTNSVTVIDGVVTEQINGVTIGIITGISTNNQVITNSESDPVGTEANPSVIADSTVTVNGDSLGENGSVVAEGSVDLVVNLDGSPSGSWDGDSWEVTSAVCADATVNVNGVFMENIPSGDTENIEVRQETGATLVGSKQGQYWRVDDATVENSDASYSATVAAEGSLVVPDTPISANGDLVINQPSTIAKDLVVRYDTEGVVPTVITSGEIVVPDSGIIAGREAFVTFGTSANVAWNKLDKFGTLITLANANIAVWQDKEAGEVSIEFTYTVVVERLTGANDFWLGFDESAAPTNATSQFTGFYYSATNSLKFMENGVDMGVIDNPSIQNWAIYKCTRNITDGIFRAYRDGTLIYTSSHSSVGDVFPWVKSAGANNKPISNIYVTT